MLQVLTSFVVNRELAKCISVQRVKVTRKSVELERQYTENVAAMNEKETYATPGVMLAFAIVLTCLWFITVFGVLSGVFGQFSTIWHLFIEPMLRRKRSSTSGG
jgi:nucleoside permease NupC